jgi:hypothetical protein
MFMHLGRSGSRSLSRLLAVSLAVAASAQETQPPAGHSMHGEAFNEGPRQAAYLMAGTGDVHFPVTTKSPEAQRFFDQGIGQLHGFWYFEAERSFRQVALLDPDCGMAYWGMAMANLNQRERAAGFMRQALQHRKYASAKERQWIDGLAAYYQVLEPAAKSEAQPATSTEDKSEYPSEPAAMPVISTQDAEAPMKEPGGKQPKKPAATERDEKRLARELVRNLEEIVASDRQDIEATAFLVTQLWQNTRNGLPITSHLANDALLDRVFAASPMHPAHHYRIHLWDTEKAERALASAARCGPSAPGIAHMWHMSGHIFAKLHRHADAAWQQEASARVDHAHLQRDRVMPYQIFNYGHNNEWLARSLSHVGRVGEALAIAKDMLAQPRHPEHNRIDESGSIAEYGHRRLVDLLATYELWDEALALAPTPWLAAQCEPAPQVQRLELLGRAAFSRGQLELGRRCQQDLEVALQQRRRQRGERIDAAEAAAIDAKENDDKISAAMQKALQEETRELRRLEGSGKVLTGYELLAAGELQPALEKLADTDLDKWALAELQLVAGKADDAIAAIAKLVEGRQGQVPPLARQVWILERASQRDAARSAFEKLRVLADRADLDTPLLARLAPLATELGWPADWRQPPQLATDIGERPSLDDLGPLRWTPVAAPPLRLRGANDTEIALTEYRGRPVLVVFYLGFGCLHCIEQLREFKPFAAKFAEQGIDLAVCFETSCKRILVIR